MRTHLIWMPQDIDLLRCSILLRGRRVTFPIRLRLSLQLRILNALVFFLQRWNFASL